MNILEKIGFRENTMNLIKNYDGNFFSTSSITAELPFHHNQEQQIKEI